MQLLNDLCGLRIIETELVGDAYEDWSQVRSKGRARRRRAKHPQRIVTRYRANGKVLHEEYNRTIYVHPHDAIRLRQAMQDRARYA